MLCLFRPANDEHQSSLYMTAVIEITIIVCHPQHVVVGYFKLMHIAYSAGEKYINGDIRFL